MKELANDPEELETYAHVRVAIMHRWYGEFLRELRKGEGNASKVWEV